MLNIKKIGEFYEFDIFWSFGETNPELRARLIRFWMENGAIPDPYVAWRRTFEVGCIVTNKNGDIVGVNSIYADQLTSDSPSYWLYRAFTRPDSRLNGLTPRLFHLTYEELKSSYATEAGSPVGIAMIIENLKLDTRAGSRILQRAGLEFLGTNVHGKSIWRKSFPDIISHSHP
jgi:hypothetical protein